MLQTVNKENGGIGNEGEKKQMVVGLGDKKQRWTGEVKRRTQDESCRKPTRMEDVEWCQFQV